MIQDATAAFDEFVTTFSGTETGTGGDAVASVDWDSSSAVVERAARYIAKMPIAVDGSNGSSDCFRVACVCRKGFLLSIEESLQAMHEWNLACQPPWSEKELRHKLQDAGKASGPSGYLRKTQEHKWESVNVPTYTEPARKRKVEEPATVRTTLKQSAYEYLSGLGDNGANLLRLGLPEVDEAIGGGVEAGEIVLMAARPSHGKSALALQIVDHVTGSGIPCAFMSEEMSSLLLGKRAAQSISSIPSELWHNRREIVRQHLDDHFRSRAECFVIERSRTAERVAESICSLAKTDGVRLVVVDYVQLLTNNRKSRYETVTESSVILKQAASESGVVLVSLAQVSRAFESRDALVPKVSDLKESGQLEQDADVIMFLVWPHRMEQQKDPHEYQIYVVKNRNREIVRWNVTLKFEPSRQRVVLPVNDWEPNL